MDIVAYLTARTCSRDGCGRSGKLTRGMCARCYRYWLDHTPPGERGPAPRFTRTFWDFVQKTHEHGCWLWTGPRDKKGYGLWCGEGVKSLAHRHSWSLANGPIPDGKWVLHHCDTPPCVNPVHLYPGTIIENTRDMVTRGRSYRPPRQQQCSEGHAIVGDNLRIVARKGYASIHLCRVCDNARSRERQRARRAAAPRTERPVGCLTTAEVLARYPVGRTTLGNWQRDGRLRCRVIGRTAWWTEGQVKAIVATMNPDRGRRAS